MLAMLERAVTNAGGTHAFCDTDSMAIVCSYNPDPIPCPTIDGTDQIYPLSPVQVRGILDRFQPLNPCRIDLIRGLWRAEHEPRRAAHVLRDLGQAPHPLTVTTGRNKGLHELRLALGRIQPREPGSPAGMLLMGVGGGSGRPQRWLSIRAGADGSASVFNEHLAERPVAETVSAAFRELLEVAHEMIAEAGFSELPEFQEIFRPLT